MAQAYECDLCKKLVKDAQSKDVYHPKRIHINITYATAVGSRPLDLCFECRLDLLRYIIQGIEAKQKYTWADLKEPHKLAEVL